MANRTPTTWAGRVGKVTMLGLQIFTIPQSCTPCSVPFMLFLWSWRGLAIGVDNPTSECARPCPFERVRGTHSEHGPPSVLQIFLFTFASLSMRNLIRCMWYSRRSSHGASARNKNPQTRAEPLAGPLPDIFLIRFPRWYSCFQPECQPSFLAFIHLWFLSVWTKVQHF